MYTNASWASRGEDADRVTGMALHIGTQEGEERTRCLAGGCVVVPSIVSAEL